MADETLAPASSEALLKELEAFQQKAVDDVLVSLLGLIEAGDLIEEGGNALLVAPPGGGKTGMGVKVAEGIFEARPGSRGLFLTHRLNLFNQFCQDVEDWSKLPVGTFSASKGIDQSERLVAGTVQSVAARLDDLEFYDFVIIDEAHHARATEEDEDVGSQYDAVLRRLEEISAERGQTLQLLGLTATPFRHDDRLLDRRLQMARRTLATYTEALEAGRIVKPETINPNYRLKPAGKDSKAAASEYLHDLVSDPGLMKNGMLDEAELRAAHRERRPDDYLDQAVAAWKAECKDGRPLKTIAFCNNQSEVDKLFEVFESAGIRARRLYSKLGKAESEEVIADYHANQFDVMVTCEMVGEGFDAKDTEAVLVTRTSSTRRWYAQMTARCLRADGQKTHGKVIDMGLAPLLLGPMEDQIEMQRALESMWKGSSAEQADSADALWTRHPSDPELAVLSCRDKIYVRWDRDDETRIFHLERAKESDGEDAGSAKRKQKNRSGTATVGQRFKRVAEPGLLNEEFPLLGGSTWGRGQIVTLTAGALEKDFAWQTIRRNQRAADLPGGHYAAFAERDLKEAHSFIEICRHNEIVGQRMAAKGQEQINTLFWGSQNERLECGRALERETLQPMPESGDGKHERLLINLSLAGLALKEVSSLSTFSVEERKEMRLAVRKVMQLTGSGLQNPAEAKVLPPQELVGAVAGFLQDKSEALRPISGRAARFCRLIACDIEARLKKLEQPPLTREPDARKISRKDPAGRSQDI